MRRTSVSFSIAGLKGSYKFKEVHIPVPSVSETSEVHSVLYFQVLGAVRELEYLGLINGFHFIVHKDVDLRLSTPDWRKNVTSIKSILERYDIPSELENWGPLPRSTYGGKYGEVLCYNSLELNSRMILGFLEARRLEFRRPEVFNTLDWLVVSQLSHYLYYQYGLVGTQEIDTLFEVYVIRLRALLRNVLNRWDEGEVSEGEFTRYLNGITGRMVWSAKRVKADFKFSIWKRLMLFFSSKEVEEELGSLE